MAALCAASPAYGDSNGSSEAAVKAAANASKFRVIQRIPPVRRPIVEAVVWPFPDAVKQAVSNDDWQAAWKALEKTKPPADDEKFAFLWAWIALGAQANDRAELAFAKLAEGNGLFVDYANLYAGEAAFRAARHEKAAAYAARVPSDSVPHRAASLLLGRALLKSGEKEQGKRALRAFLDAFPNDDEAPLARMELARALHLEGAHAEAAKLLVEVRTKSPLWSGLDDKFEVLEKAVRDKLTSAQRKDIYTKTTGDWLAEYRVRFAAHQSEQVTTELGKAVAKWPKKSSDRCEALYLVAASHTKLRKHSDSVPWYEKAVAGCSGDTRRKALYKGGKAYWNAGRKDDALTYFEKLWNEFSTHSYADDAMFFSARILREQDKTSEAEKLLKRQVVAYPDGDMASDAHWLMVREMFAQQKYQAAVDYVQGLKDTGERDLYSKGRLAYFRARALQKLKKDEAAKAAYQTVVREFPMSYYSLFALNRLAELTGETAADVCAIDGGAVCSSIPLATPTEVVISDELKSDLAFQRGKAFLQVALDGFAQLEFHRLRRRAGEDAEKQWAIAGLLDASGAYPYSHDIPRRHINGWEDEYPDRERSVRWHIGYPTPFSEEVDGWAAKRKLPEALIWAIMREESGFNPRVHSWAGAIGLMQLMPGTAKMMAKEDGWTYDAAALTTPDTAIRIGSAYLKDLADRSSTHPVFVISGYNGGWGNVSRWMKEPDSRDLDLWVEDIPYGQTRDYTKRVLRTFWVYSWMYGENQVPRFDLKVPG